MSDFVSGKDYFGVKNKQPVFQITANQIYETLKEWHSDDPDQFKDPDLLTQDEIDTLLEKLNHFYFSLSFSGSKLEDWWLILADSGVLIPDTQEATV